MRETILALENASKSLEPDSGERENLRNKIVHYTEDFLTNIGTRKAFEADKNKGRKIMDIAPGKDLFTVEEVIELLKETLDKEGINPASGGHLGYIPGGGIYASSLADYWADITNRYAAVFFANPSAVRVENRLIQWMSEIVGYPSTAHGNLTSGGSIANLTGIVTARESKGIKAAKVQQSAIYLTRQAHLSIVKALNITGLQEAVIHYIALDESFRMDMGALKETIATDIAHGITPFLLVGSAGTTDMGEVDPLEEMADIAAEHDLWFHVDAAYGGFFLLSDPGKEILKGIERSDSVVVDPHKGLFLPYGLGACLVRDGKKLQKAFTVHASYLQDMTKATEEINPMDVSPEMTKHFRGLRLWLPLMLYGSAPFKACLEEKLLLAKYFCSEIQKIPGFVVPIDPRLSVVVFRYVPEMGDANAFNKRLVEEIHADGRIFFSSTTIEGHFMLRLAILSFRTHLHTIDLTIDILKEKVGVVQKENVFLTL